MSYKTIIGLEIHAELLTDSKIFCTCTTEFGGDVNTHCCPVCLGLPGTLPVVNKKVVEYAMRAGLALNCEIAENSKMDRKNYFYPDLPKAYQISQYDMPLCTNGYIEIETDEGPKKIRIRRIHIEEDTGKSLHSEDGASLLDYNRCGVPLIEIVTEPDMNSSEEAHRFLEKLKAILQYIEVSDCRMEQGSLRCDVNINVVSEDNSKKSNIVELKNLNSFKAAVKAMDYEEKRHIELLEKEENTKRETRRWDDVKNETIVMRSKEEVQDYRYFPEPDIVEFHIEREWVDDVKNSLPELPHDKKERFIREYDIPEYDAGVLVSSKRLADFFEDTVKEVKDSKLVSNWVMTEVLRRINDAGIEIEDMKFTHKKFAKLLKFIEDKTISNNIAKKVFRDMFETGKDPERIIEEKGLKQITDEGAIKEIVKKVVEANPQSIVDYKNGKDRALGFLVGQVMKESRGKANPQVVNKLIREMID